MDIRKAVVRFQWLVVIIIFNYPNVRNVYFNNLTQLKLYLLRNLEADKHPMELGYL